MKNKYINFILVIAILLLVAWLIYDYNYAKEPNIDDQTNVEQNGDNNTTNDNVSDTNNNTDENANDEIPIDQETKTDSGRYTGRIDNNSIEVRISGVPDEIDPRVFRLSDEVKEMFDSLNLNEGDNIKFDYIVGENDQQIIVKVEKM